MLTYEQILPMHMEEGLRKITPEAGVTYTCPMHPQILQEGPGNCPLCGMTPETAPDGGCARHVPQYCTSHRKRASASQRVIRNVSFPL